MNDFKLSVTPDEDVSAILPSYFMYKATVGVSVMTAEQMETQNIDPPTYINENNPRWSSSLISPILSENLYISPVHAQQFVPSSESPVPITNEHQEVGSEEKILDNVYRLPNLSLYPNKVGDSIRLQIHFTKEIGELGKKPEFINPYVYEYQQGDVISGYIVIENASSKPIPFDMFVVLFEGVFMITNSDHGKSAIPVKIKKFLELFDFSASWTEATINRLRSESRNPYIWLDLVDPVDGISISLSNEKFLTPYKKYKRFFTFKIPHNLLDSECNNHNLSKHVKLPPTIGNISDNEQHIKTSTRSNYFFEDFSFSDTSISYGVTARFIGRVHPIEQEFGKIDIPYTDDRLQDSKGDPFIVLKELTSHVRVIPKTINLTNEAMSLKDLENQILFENFIQRIEEKIKTGRELIKQVANATTSNNYHIVIPDIESDVAKRDQLYKPNRRRDIKQVSSSIKQYESFTLINKRSFTGTNTISGALYLSTPNVNYIIDYIPPKKYRTQSDVNSSWKLVIPLKISIKPFETPMKSQNLPTIKSISADMVVVTIKSPKYPIPIEFDHGMLYNNDTGQPFDETLFKNNIVEPFKEYALELYQLSQELGEKNFNIERQLSEDIKSMCQLQCKISELHVANLKINGHSWNKKTTNWSISSKEANASVDVTIKLEYLSHQLLKSLPESLKSYNRFNFIPDFQSCYMSRLYHINLNIVLSCGTKCQLRIPLRVQKR